MASSFSFKYKDFYKDFWQYTGLSENVLIVRVFVPVHAFHENIGIAVTEHFTSLFETFDAIVAQIFDKIVQTLWEKFKTVQRVHSVHLKPDKLMRIAGNDVYLRLFLAHVLSGQLRVMCAAVVEETWNRKLMIYRSMFQL